MFGGAASYGIFFYFASKGNLTALSSLTFLTPVFAAAGGYLALVGGVKGGGIHAHACLHTHTAPPPPPHPGAHLALVDGVGGGGGGYLALVGGV